MKRTGGIVAAVLVALGLVLSLPLAAQQQGADEGSGAGGFGVEAAGGGNTAGGEVRARVAGARGEKTGEPRIVADLSTHTVAIKTDFAGTRVMLFGALVGASEEGKARPDLVVVIRGPSKTFKIHRKKRVGPIWVNADERVFRAAPGYYALLATNLLDNIAPPEKLRARGIGYQALKDHLLATGEGFRDLKEAEEYAEAFVRLMKKKGLYRTNDNGVNFTGRYLFRATFDLPANVPLGEYEADVYLWREGRLLGKFSSRLEIEKRGFERFVYEIAHKQPLLYGVAAVIIAIAAGYAAAAIFRKS
jgi:uncharacterized protein (TIGR02186 family)